ncbi:hypothetical protein O4273_24150 [Rhodococcus ruber]|uniref:hypothetical protein n=1 Tax=Rhodococcus ruber TaxID=1830 RepID=UPI0022B402EE|nr:hypothetical protein [Rhodococcus ruber]MCZ4505926.1 hypothetical protein [Rhodococcus ruber]
MADEATPTETTVTETVAEDTTPVAETAGGADQTAENTDNTTQVDTPEAETDTPADEPEERTYTKAAAEASEKAIAERIGKALGLIPEENDQPVDPAVLLEQAAEREAQIANERDAARAEIAAYRLEQALTKAANNVDGDLDILVPYLRGTGALDKLDPTADDYNAHVAEIVTHAVEANAKLKKAAPVAAPARSGGDLNGGTGAPKRGPKSVEDFIREAREKRARDL